MEEPRGAYGEDDGGSPKPMFSLYFYAPRCTGRRAQFAVRRLFASM